MDKLICILFLVKFNTRKKGFMSGYISQHSHLKNKVFTQTYYLEYIY